MKPVATSGTQRCQTGREVTSSEIEPKHIKLKFGTRVYHKQERINLSATRVMNLDLAPRKQLYVLEVPGLHLCMLERGISSRDGKEGRRKE